MQAPTVVPGAVIVKAQITQSGQGCQAALPADAWDPGRSAPEACMGQACFVLRWCGGLRRRLLAACSSNLARGAPVAI